jgi:transposase-like protein
MSRRPYPTEFRERAVELVRSSGRKCSEVAKELGMNDSTLQNWVREAEIDAGQREGLTTEERKELLKLRSEAKKLREENEFLKKATAYFAREAKPVR